MPRNAGFSTDGDTLSVLFVGPMAPATNRGLLGSRALNLAVTDLASSAAVLLMKYTSSFCCSS